MTGGATRTDRPWGALLLDMDGTLIDSMPLHERSWAQWFVETGLARNPADGAGDDFFASTAGRTNAEILRDLLPAASEAEIAALAERKEVIYREIARRELQLIAGAAEFCQAARAAGIRLAVCTAAPRANIAVASERFGLTDWVDAITSPDDGLRGKPHPDIFLAAAQKLGVAPADCLVYEDAPLGIEAARRAGMGAVALTTTLPASAFSGQAHVLDVIADYRGHRWPARRA
ncbi:MAG: hypothetical protein RL722_1533 [Pseudomonadota bacterium]|jgi:HAD superfamily hydrolase (TIGR01509 family)